MLGMCCMLPVSYVLHFLTRGFDGFVPIVQLTIVWLGFDGEVAIVWLSRLC